MSLEDIVEELKKLKPLINVGKELTATIAKDGTVSGAVDLGGHFSYLLITIPTLDSADVSLQCSLMLDGTYQDLSDAVYAAATGAKNNTFKLGGWRYIKVKVSAAQTTLARSFTVKGVTF